MNVLGLDLSLNATGLAMLSLGDRPAPELIRNPRYEYKRVDSPGFCYQGMCIAPVPPSTLDRWEAIVLTVLAWAQHANTIVIEGYAFSTNMAFAAAIRELGGIVRFHLLKRGLIYTEISPTALKKFLTGSGKADKRQILEGCFYNFGLELENHNMADAFGLAKIGELLAKPDEELVRLDRYQREVIGAIRYPTPKVRKTRGRKLKFGEVA